MPVQTVDPSPLASSPVPLRWRRIFPGEKRQIAQVRRFIEGLLPDCPARGDVIVCAVELANNCLHHTSSGRSGVFAIELCPRPTAIRVCVADSGAPTAPRFQPSSQSGGVQLAESGRGLLLVAGIAEYLGVVGDGRGRMVWADVPWPDHTDVLIPEPGYLRALQADRDLLARRHPQWLIWFGEYTLTWCAVPRRPLPADTIITATDARLLGRQLDIIRELRR